MPLLYFFATEPCGTAATAVGLAFAPYGENCELSNVPVLELIWYPDTVLARKFAVKRYWFIAGSMPMATG